MEFLVSRICPLRRSIANDLFCCQSPPFAPRDRDRRHVARDDILSVAVLPSVSNGEAHRAVLHRCPGLCRRGRPGFGRVPEDGRRPRSGRVPVDVPGVRHHHHSARHRPALVAPGPANSTGGADSSAKEISAMAATESPRADGPRRRGPLPRSAARLPPAVVDAARPGPRHAGLAIVAAADHVLWRRGRGQQHRVLRHRDHRGDEPVAERH